MKNKINTLKAKTKAFNKSDARKFIEDLQSINQVLSNKLAIGGQRAKNVIKYPLAPYALVFNVASWKREFVRNYLPEYRLVYVGLNDDLSKYENLVESKDVVIIVWGRSILAHIQEFKDIYNLPLYHLEDGFIRSIGLGANHIAPMSICFDKRGLYFDSSKPSDLEHILNNYNFKENPRLLLEAQDLMTKILEHKVSKYNLPDTNLSSNIYGPKTRKRILVIGQVEDDQSLIYGCKDIPSNYDLLKLAVDENPDAQVIYKIHPDILYGKRKELSDTTELKNVVDIIDVNMSLFDALNGVDRVYTMTSLAGFEALMHGVPVTTIGAPFYSSWGLTDDRYPINRRRRERSLIEVFAAAYILYPRYRTLDSLHVSDLSETVDYIIENKNRAFSTLPEKKFAYLSFYNLQTMMRVDNRLITKLKFDSMALISDSEDSANIAASINQESGVNVNLLSFYDDPSQLEYNVPQIEGSNKGNIYYDSVFQINDVQGTGLRNESDSINTRLVNSLYLVLKEIFSDVIDEETLKTLSYGIAPKCLPVITKFISMRDALLAYDALIVHMEDPDFNIDVIKAIYYYAEALGKENTVFLSTSGENPKKIIESIKSLDEKYPLDVEVIKDIRVKAVSFWYDINHEGYYRNSNHDEFISVCGSLITDESIKGTTEGVLKVLGESKKKVLFFDFGLFEAEDLNVNHIKKSLIELEKQQNSKVYNFSDEYYLQKFAEINPKYKGVFSESIPRMVLNQTSDFIPIELLSILKVEIINYCKKIQYMMCLISDIDRMSANNMAFITIEGRSTLSKLLVGNSNKNDIKTLSYLPSIISTQYVPNTNVIGVADQNIKDRVAQTASSKARIYNVGSLNISQQLRELALNYESTSCNKKQFDIYFELPTASESIMEPIFSSLETLASKYELSIAIKPNLNHILPLYYDIRNRFSAYENIKVLPREGVNISTMLCSKLLVGPLSNDLLVLALYGKDVAIGHFGLDDNYVDIDLHSYVLHFDILNEDSMKALLIDLIQEKKEWKELQNKRKEYLYSHQNFKYPYNIDKFERFISEAFSSDSI